MGDSAGKLGFLLFYVTFYLIVTIIGVTASASGNIFGANQPITEPPTATLELPEISPPEFDGGIITTTFDLLVWFFSAIIYIIVVIFQAIVFLFSYLFYFFGLQGLTLFGISSGLSIIISLPLSVGFFYVLLSLVRGGS